MVRQIHKFAGVEVALRQIDPKLGAVAQQMIHSLGPGDQIGAKIGGVRREHHAQHRHAIAQQRDGDGAAATALQEGAGAVLRVHQPAIGRAGAFDDAAFLANEPGWDEAQQTFPQEQLQLHVDIGFVGSTQWRDPARAVGAKKLRRQHSARFFHDGDHLGQDRTRQLVHQGNSPAGTSGGTVYSRLYGC